MVTKSKMSSVNRWPVIITIAVATAICLVMGTSIHLIRKHADKEYQMLLGQIYQVEIELLQGYLKFEKLSEADGEEGRVAALQHFMAAESLLDAAISSGVAIKLPGSDSKTGEMLSDRLARSRKDIITFKNEIIRQRLQAEPGQKNLVDVSDAEMKFAAMYERFKSCKDMARQLMTAGLNRFEKAVAVIIIFGAVLGCYMIFTLVYFGRRQQSTEKALRESHQMLEMVIDNIPSRVFWKDRELNYLGCNRLFALDAGLNEPDEIIGKNDYELAWKKQADLYRSDDAKVIKSEKLKLNYEEVQTNPQGRQLWLRTNKMPLRDAWGTTIGVIGTYEDITERKATEVNLKESEARLRAILDAIPDFMFQLSRDGVFLNYAAAQNDLYTSPDHFLNRQINDVLPPELARMTAENVERTLNTSQMQVFEYELLIGEETRQYEARMVVCSEDSVLVIVRDITERNKSEMALRESLQTSADIVAAIPSGLFIYQFEEPDQLLLIASNPEAEMLTGIKIAEWKGREFNDIWPDGRHEGLTEKFLEVIKTGKTFVTENQRYEDDRLEGSFRIRAFSMEGGKLGVAFENITERTRAYEILRESEERYRYMHKNIPIMMHSIDADGRLTNVSNNWLETLGYSRDEVIGRRFDAFLTERSRQYAIDEAYPKFSQTGFLNKIPLSIKRRNGEIEKVLLSEVAERDSSGNIKSALAVLINLLDIEQAEGKIDRFNDALTRSPSSVLIINPDGLVSYVNPKFVDASGYSADEIIGKSPVILSCGGDEVGFDDTIWKSILSELPWNGNLQFRRKNGQLYWDRISVTPVSNDAGKITEYLVIGEDISAELMIHQKMVESDKLSAIGLLAAGVAHGFKNYLCGIIGNASLMMEEKYGAHTPGEIRDALSAILDSSEKANELASSLLSYSQASTLKFQPENLRQIIESTIKLVGREMRKLAIDIVTYYEDLSPINVSKSRIQQLLLNLIINARQSIRSRGIITISLLQGEDVVFLKVSDTGQGISKEAIPRIFDPFYSTKGVWGEEDNTGIGMGLAICRNIAREHKGELTVESISGAGTTFILTLPLADNSALQINDGVPLLNESRILIYSQDDRMISRYFQTAQKLGLAIFWITNLTALNEDDLDMDLMICDGRVAHKADQYKLAVYCSQKNIPLVTIHKQNAPTEVVGMSEYAFDELPKLEEIIKNAQISVYNKPVSEPRP